MWIVNVLQILFVALSILCMSLYLSTSVSLAQRHLLLLLLLCSVLVSFARSFCLFVSIVVGLDKCFWLVYRITGGSLVNSFKSFSNENDIISFRNGTQECHIDEIEHTYQHQTMPPPIFSGIFVKNKIAYHTIDVYTIH